MEKIKVAIFEDEFGWSIYNEGGQCLESDFDCFDSAYNFAIDQEWGVVDSFNI